MGSLVSGLLTRLTRGLEALQNEGVTLRMWRRLANDHGYAHAVAYFMKDVDVKSAGVNRTVKFAAGDTRSILYDKLAAGVSKHFGLLRKDIVMLLSPDATTTDEPCSEDYEVELFLTRLWTNPSEEELAEELKARQLVSATCEEMLAFARQHDVPRDGRILVPGARIASFDTFITEPHWLSLGRVIIGDPTLSVAEARHGVSAGSYVLTKRPK